MVRRMPVITRHEFVNDQITLEARCREWADEGLFAFDTEFIRDETYHAILCLVQVADQGRVSIIDPTADIDLSPFWDLVVSERVTSVVHAGKEDFEVCLAKTGRPPRNVFDVQIAAGLAGFHYPLNLVRLIGEVLGRRIRKGETLTDWLRRPLTDEQLRYAVEDVAHLPAAYARLRTRLEKCGRLAWAREEFARFEDPSIYRPPAQTRCYKIKGAKKLDRPALAVLESLLEWRDGWARHHDRPARAIMRDDIAVEIARRQPSVPEDLHILRGFPQGRNARIARDVLDAVRTALERPKSEWPQPIEHHEPTPISKAVVELLSAVARCICDEAGVSHDLVGGPSRIRELIESRENGDAGTPALLVGWRGELIGRRLIDVLEGRTELLLSGWPARTRLDLRPRST
ncbi:MAG: Ribonuclease D [Phycisphaerae bacterium]|nr:Ribonuclease D [Phycisphaerae bacterium]